MRFVKPPLSYQQQIDLLVSRGMNIPDHDRAHRYLSHLNYYRLAAYWLPFEEDHATHRFRQGTTFDVVLNHYIFDRELRLLVMDAIERFEVSLRTRWAYHLAHTYGAHAHLDSALFKPKWNHRTNVQQLRESVKNSSETFIRHLRFTYDEQLPPVWALCEIMTLGQLSRWYCNLRHRKDRNAVARCYDMDESHLVSFLHHLTLIRNFCAHHARLWNREFAIALKLPQKRPARLVASLNPHSSKRIYNGLTYLAYMMDSINPGHQWKQRFGALLQRYPQVHERPMGFPDHWRDCPIWRGIV